MFSKTPLPITSETVLGIVTESSVMTFSAELTKEAEPEQTLNSFYEILLYGTTIHGIKIFGLRSTTGLYEIYQGGLGHETVVFRFYSAFPGQGFSFFIEIYQNGEKETTFNPTAVTENTSTVTISTTHMITDNQTPNQTTPAVSTTTFVPTTTELPEKRIMDWGVINNESVLLTEKRFQNYPSVRLTAIGNGSLESSKTILGIKLTSLNYTDGFANLTSGGINYTFVNFDFKGTNLRKAYDFDLELFGNNAVSRSLSVTLMILLSNAIFFFK
ncbi:hypothetical protein ACKWTF_000135 [Chironomus riparius]